MQNKKYLIIGDVFIDVHLDDIQNESPFIRLGGIFHAVRAFSAIEENFGQIYFAPSYLVEDIELFSKELSSQYSKSIGEVINSPNLMLVSDSKETSSQGYLDLLKMKKEISYSDRIELNLKEFCPTDVLLFPGKYDVKRILQLLAKQDCKIHIDIQYDFDLEDFLEGQEIETVFVSTSSKHIQRIENKSTVKLVEKLSTYSIKTLVIKENRGGSLIYNYETQKMYNIPAFISSTTHSVGVGDVYDVVYICMSKAYSTIEASKCASYAASIYAQTYNYIVFKNRLKFLLGNVDKISSLNGVRVSWDSRPTINIYIAAPDFPTVDTRIINAVQSSLKYHNFSPRLPIRENGLYLDSMTKKEELALFFKDFELLSSCDLLIAVILINDPGTYVELGIFKQMGKPTIVYDPFGMCQNMFAKNTADYFCTNLSEVVNATFVALKGTRNEE